MPNLLPMIADRALNRPLLVTPAKAEIIAGVLGGRIGIADGASASRFVGDQVERDQSGRPVRAMPYRVADGVALVSIVGTLVNRGAWIGASSGLVSYEGIAHQINSAVADPKVHSILLDMDTPGGEAVGCAEVASLLASAGRTKRTVALVAGQACSAGYWIASAADEIVTTETGVSGSIGVVMLHADYSRAIDAQGVTPTLIFAGAHKVDGNPFEPLSETVRADFQDEVNAFYSMFVRGVAKGRGARLNAEAARATEAKTYVGKAAVDAGLADRVGTLQSVLADLSRARGRKSTKGSAMETETAIAEASAAAITAARTEGLAEGERIGEERGRRAGAEAERARLAAIMSAEGIAGNPAAMLAALTLATDAPDMAAETVAKHVAAKQTAAPRAPGIESRTADPLGLAALGQDQAIRADNDLNPASIYNRRRGG